MAKTTELELAIKIAGKVDPSLLTSINTANKQVSSLAKGMQTAAKVATTATAAAIGIASAAFVDVTKEAMKFEANMAGVVKVTEGLRDKNGKLTDTYYEIADAIQYLSTKIPVNTEQLTNMAAVGAQSGVPVKDLVDFAEDSSKMAIAFEIDPTSAAEMMAKWRTAFSMNQDQVVLLADEINYLANRTSSSEEQIADVVTRIGNLGEIGGVSTETLAVLGAMLTSVGMESENAATAVKRMILEMTSGESVTARQAAVLDKLGISAADLAESMQTDSVGAIQNFLVAIGQLPKAEQLSALNDFFGSWAVQGVSSLSQKLPEMIDWLNKVGDVNTYAGSLEQEYAGFASTTESSWKMLQNTIEVIKQDLGQYQLSNVNSLILQLKDGLVEIDQNLPSIVDQLDAFIGKLIDNGPQLIKIVGGIAAAWLGMRFAPQIEGFLGGTKNALVDGINMLAGGTSVAAGAAGTGGPTTIGAALANYGKTSVNRAGAIGAGVSNAVSFLPSLLQTLQADKALSGASTLQMAGTMAADALGATKTGSAVKGYFGGIRTAAGNLANTKIGGGLWSGIKGTGQVSAQVLAGIAGPEGLGLTTLASNAAGLAKSGAGFIGGKASSAAAMVAGSGIGQAVGGFAGKAAGIGGTVMGALGSFAGAGAGLLSSIMGPVAGVFGTILTGALPIVGVIGSIIAVVSILGDNLEGIRTTVGNVFGAQGLAVFDGFMGAINNVKNTLVQAFSPESLESVRASIVSIFGSGAGSAFDGLLSIGSSIAGVAQQLVQFGTGPVKSIFQNVISFIQTTVAPAIINLITLVSPYVSQIVSGLGTAIMTVATMITTVIQAVWPVVQTVLTGIIAGVQVVGPAVLGALSSIAGSISGVITAISGVLNGLITFIAGVFTGKWAQVWEGVKQIFGSAFDALVELCKAPINAVIGLINGAINGINSIFGNGITIPDWVPVVGGESFALNLPNIPQLAAGGFTNGVSIAGEAGPEAVISFDPAYRSSNIANWMRAGQMLGVPSMAFPKIPMLATGGFTNGISIAGEAGTEAVISFNPAYRSSNITNWMRAGQMLEMPSLTPAVEMPDLSGGPGNNQMSFSYNPQVKVEGNADEGTITRALDMSYEKFKQFVKQLQREQDRRRY